jgi:methyl-accepting chemotaxis protein
MFSNTKSLKGKIIGSAAIAVVGLLSVSTVIQLVTSERNLRGKLREQSIELASALEASLRHAMMTADGEAIDVMMEKVAALEQIDDIFVLRPDRSIARSTEAGAAGRQMAEVTIDKAAANQDAYAELVHEKGHPPFVRAVSVLVADKDCVGCHSDLKAGDPAGFLVVERWAEKDLHALQTARVRLVLMSLGIAAIILLLLGWLTSKITRPLESLTSVAERVSSGDIEHRIEFHSQDEIGRLADSFRSLSGYLREVAAGAEALSQGDLSATITPRSDRDVLARSFSHVLGSLRGLVSETHQLTAAATEGRLSIRGNSRALGGGYRDLLEGINATLDAVVLPIQEAQVVLERIADRDLTARVRGEYQGDHARIKTALNLAADNLDDGLGQVASAVDQVSAAAAEIGSGSQVLARGANDQASALETVSSSLQEMSSMTKMNTNNAKEAQKLAESASSRATRGLESMQQLSGAIVRIRSSSNATAKIVKTIDEIAFQTNLLALNAAVEAARAGDAGKGFAVVAEEVRNLAMRSAEAAKNTADLIDESIRNAEEVAGLNAAVLDQLTEITQQANTVGEVMAEIAVGNEQQSLGIDQITAAVDQMNTVTQQTASGSEESASAAEELASQSAELRSLTSEYRLSGVRSSAGGSGRPGASFPPSPSGRQPRLELVRGSSGLHKKTVELGDDEDKHSLSQF